MSIETRNALSPVSIDGRRLVSPLVTGLFVKINANMPNNRDNSDHESSRFGRFFRCMNQNQKQIHAYILIMVHDYHNAEDLMQETAIILWQKFDEYEPGTSFSAWGMHVARNVVFNYRRKYSNRSQLFDDHMCKILEDYAQDRTRELSATEEFLRECINKLKPVDRHLIKLRYEQRIPVQNIATQVKRSADSLYHSFSRIYAALKQCVSQQLESRGISI
jgi:RNA polymerase sigma-70 factor (ECF subfamily)